MIQRTAIALLSLVALTLAGGSQSNHITIVRPTNFLEDIVVPGYSSASGPLRNVAICFRWQHVRAIDGESSDAEPAIVDVSFEPGWLQLRQEGDVLADIPFPSVSQIFALSEFDGSLDMAGTSGFSWNSFSAGADVVLIEDPEIVSRFVDVRNVALTAEGFDLFTASGSGNLDALSLSRIAIFVEVVYDSSL